MMLWKGYTQYASKYGNSAVATGLENVGFIPIPKKGNAKEFSNYHTIAHIWHASKVMLKMLQAKLQQYIKQELPDVQAGFRKGRGTRNQIANIHWIIEKECSRKTSTSASLTTLKPLTVWITTNCGKFLKKWEYQTTLPALWETSMQVKKQQLEPDMEQQNGSKLGKEYVKAVYSHPAYLTSMQSTSCKMSGWKAQAGIKIAGRNINNLRYTDDTTLMAEGEEELKRLLIKVKEGIEKAGLKLSIQKMKIIASSPITSW